MADDVLEMLSGKRSLREMMDGPPKRLPPAEAEPNPANAQATDDWVSLPSPGDSYTARSRASNKPISTLHLLLADASSRGFGYSNLDTIDLLPAQKPGCGPILVLRFAGIVPQEIVITGRSLATIRDYLGQHRIAWLRQIPPGRDFLGDGEELILGIEIRRLDE